MEHIRDVIHRTDTPTSINSVPTNFGSASAGTMKADEWRTLFAIYLPVALICLWGEDSPHPLAQSSEHARDILQNTMDLVCAVLVATKRMMSPRRARAYRDYLVRYVEGLKVLYPDHDIKPNVHMAFHVYEFLLLYGPMHSWWCFPFERLIGHLQRLPQNHIFG